MKQSNIVTSSITGTKEGVVQITLTVPDSFENLPDLRKKRIINDIQLQIEQEIEDSDDDFVEVVQEALDSPSVHESLKNLALHYKNNLKGKHV